MLLVRHATVAVLLALGLGGVLCASACGQAASLTIESESPTLEKQDSGGWTASLGFTNLTDKAIALTATPSDTTDLGCQLKLDSSSLPPAQQSKVKLMVPPGCNVTKQGIDFSIAATGTVLPKNFPVTATEKPTSTPHWHPLWIFPVLLGGLLIAATIFFACWRTSDISPTKPLIYLEATWSFSDSWVSNVTVAGALLTGIFGSSGVITALLGEDATSSVALATVGVAIATAFISAGPLVLGATKSSDSEFNTAGGLLAASAVTLTGAFGEIWILWRTGQALSLGGWENRIVIVAIAAAALLGIYAFRSLLATLNQGIKKPPPPAPSETIAAAKLIVEALEDRDAPKVRSAERVLAKHLRVIAAGAGQEHRRARKSALL
jgi:hypothetical protein